MTNEADFTGKGAAGGIAKGVETNGSRSTKTTAYFEFQVEKPVMQAPATHRRRGTRTCSVRRRRRRSLAQFVVDTTGRVETSVVQGHQQSTHELFTTAVKNALPRMRFIPAEVGGKKVKQLVQQPFSFAITK